MFEGLAHSVIGAAWIIATPFWFIVVALGALAWLLWEQQRRNGR
jgi:hypothetical protein